MNISLLGIENLVIVKNSNNFLIAKREKIQDIKKLLKK
ncbi:hypothetical protein ABC999_14505 [Fusobacterium varium]